MVEEDRDKGNGGAGLFLVPEPEFSEVVEDLKMCPGVGGALVLDQNMNTGLPFSKGRFKGHVEKGSVQGVSHDFGEEGNEGSGGEEGGERGGEKGFEYVFHALGESERGFEEAIVQGTVYCHHFPFYFF